MTPSASETGGTDRATRNGGWAMPPDDANLVSVSFGGMYIERFDLARLEMDPEHYRGATAYARAGSIPRPGQRVASLLRSPWTAGSDLPTDGARLYRCGGDEQAEPGWGRVERDGCGGHRRGVVAAIGEDGGEAHYGDSPDGVRAVGVVTTQRGEEEGRCAAP